MEVDILGQVEDRRSTARAKVLKSGVAVTVDGTRQEACVIDNLSDSGALLFVEQPEQLPEDMVLLIDGESSKRPAHIVRRDKTAVAVSFLTRKAAGTANNGWVFPPDDDRG